MSEVNKAEKIVEHVAVPLDGSAQGGIFSMPKPDVMVNVGGVEPDIQKNIKPDTLDV